MDTIVLSMLLYHKQTRGWKNGDVPPAAMRVVKQELNRRFGDIFSFDEIVERKIALENRYWTFKWVVAVDGVFWDVQNHCVHALPPIWNQILQVSSPLSMLLLLFFVFIPSFVSNAKFLKQLSIYVVV